MANGWNNAGPNTVWFNDGNGVFTDSGQRLGNGNTRNLALGDLDGDDDLDLFVLEDYNGNTRVYLNDGLGYFSDTGQTLMQGKQSYGGLALGDLDGDGDLDAWVRSFNGPETILFNDGAGFFPDVQTVSVPSGVGDLRWHDSVALGDFDGDGDLDAVVNVRGPIVLFENDPTGTFAYAGVAGTAHEGIYDIETGDLNGDGHGGLHAELPDLDLGCLVSI